MGLSEITTKISNFIVRFAKKEEHKSLIRLRTEQFVGWIAAITFVLSCFGIIIDGKEFITVQIPKFQSYIGKAILLRATFRKETAKRVLKNEFGYTSPCIENVVLVDLD